MTPEIERAWEQLAARRAARVHAETAYRVAREHEASALNSFTKAVAAWQAASAELPVYLRGDGTQ